MIGEFRDSAYWSQTFVQCIKEFVGVFMFLVAYSRMGMFDTFTAPLVFYTVQVVLAFPFVNSYLFFFMRFGPWLTQDWNWTWGVRTMGQFLSVVLFQYLGSLAAYHAVIDYQSKWENATMITSVEKGTSNTYIETRVPELLYNTVTDNDTDETRFYFMLDEFFAVLILLIGTLHLMEAVTPKLLQNAFWSIGNNGKQDPIFSGGTGFSSRHRDLHMQIQRLALAVNRIDGFVTKHEANETIKRQDTAIVDTADTETSNQIEEINAYVPVPFMLIFQLSILIAGVSRAFPSAHLSPHISFYKGYSDEHITWMCTGMRLVGGTLASFVALGYYFVWYVWVGKSPNGEEPHGTLTGPLYKYIIVPKQKHALFRAEMLRLPQYMDGIAEEGEEGLHLR